MRQMFPMSWVILMILFITVYIIFNTMSSIKIGNKKNSQSKTIMTNLFPPSTQQHL